MIDACSYLICEFRWHLWVLPCVCYIGLFVSILFSTNTSCIVCICSASRGMKRTEDDHNHFKSFIRFLTTNGESIFCLLIMPELFRILHNRLCTVHKPLTCFKWYCLQMVFFNIAFFGTGNFASIASFEISSVYRFITIFSVSKIKCISCLSCKHVFISGVYWIFLQLVAAISDGGPPYFQIIDTICACHVSIFFSVTALCAELIYFRISPIFFSFLKLFIL